jgi:hypothetical protein
VRRAQNLLFDKSTEEVVEELRLRFDVDFVDAVASVAVATVLSRRGVALSHGRFVRPYAVRIARSSVESAA